MTNLTNFVNPCNLSEVLSADSQDSDYDRFREVVLDAIRQFDARISPQFILVMEPDFFPVMEACLKRFIKKESSLFKRRLKPFRISAAPCNCCGFMSIGIYPKGFKGFGK